MPTQLAGAKRTDAFKFEGEEISQLAVSPQLVRWGGLDAEHVEYLRRPVRRPGARDRSSPRGVGLRRQRPAGATNAPGHDPTEEETHVEQ
jgi:hypothetical protein